MLVRTERDGRVMTVTLEAVGSARAVEMLLEARHYSPREAVAAGLVHRVVEPERLLEEAHATAARLARRSRRAIWASKRAAYRGLSSRWPGGFQLDRTGFLWGAVAPSTKRAMEASPGSAEAVAGGDRCRLQRVRPE